MIDILIIITAIMAFIATNIDDLFILMLFFGNSNFKNSHVVVGQYLGVISLILVSSLGYFFKFILPPIFISLLGIFPIIIGIKELVNLKRHGQRDIELSKEIKRSSILEVALVTFSNGGDNIGVYLPLFASINSYQLGVVIVVFLVMMGVWCFSSYSLVNNKLWGDKIERFGHIVFPFVLIALGIFILLK